MSQLLLPATILPATIALATLIPAGAARSVAARVAPWAALPAFVLALTADGGAIADYPWLLLGSRIGLDGAGQVFLFVTALLWTIAGPYARAYLTDGPAQPRFWRFFLLTMSGNLTLVVAQDLATFYLGFVVMTFAAYGLVVHERTPAAERAGRIYVILAVVGEALLLAGLLLAGAAADSLALDNVAAAVATGDRRNLTVFLLFAGFGVKAGALPLHVWLPLAHPVAPTPASAVLSGAMIKAGLLGWLRFLPIGEAALPTWGGAVIGLGLAAAFYGVAVGVAQRDPKTALAYSSISQMGVMTVGVGVGLAEPEALPLVTTAVAFYAVHHGLAKGALFLGVGVANGTPGGPRRRLVMAGLAFAALALAGAPLTSGAAAKGVLTGPAALAPGRWELWLGWVLPLTAVATSLLMARFLVLVRRSAAPQIEHGAGIGIWAPWLASLAASGLASWAVPALYALDGITATQTAPGYLWAAIWPILLGVLGLGALQPLGRRWRGAPPAWVEPGDVLVFEARMARAIAAFGRRRLWPAAAATGRWAAAIADRRPGDAMDLALQRAEAAISRFSAAGVVLLALIAAFYLALVWG